MIPQYAELTYEEFFESFKDKSDEEKEKLIRESICFVELSKEEVLAAASFCCDANGVEYGSSNLDNLNPAEIMEVLVAVCMEIGKIKIDLVSESEKKKFQMSRLTCVPPLPSTPASH